MDIVPYEPSLVPELAAAYNNVTGRVPHCYPVTVEEFGAVLAGLAAGGKSHDRLHSEAGFVARRDGAILGFLHAAIEAPKDAGGVEQAIVRFFWYQRGRRCAGQALLAAAEEYVVQRGMSQVEVFPQRYRYPFYHFDNAYLSEHLDHVDALLRFSGYRHAAGEVFLDWPNYEPAEPVPADVPADVCVWWQEGRGSRPGVLVQARQGEETLGTCTCVSGGEFSRADDAQDWFFVNGLGVTERMQGKGLGRYLLQYALLEMHKVGYRHAAISTAWGNYRAFLFYSNYGFRVVDWTYGSKRELNET